MKNYEFNLVKFLEDRKIQPLYCTSDAHYWSKKIVDKLDEAMLYGVSPLELAYAIMLRGENDSSESSTPGTVD